MDDYKIVDSKISPKKVMDIDEFRAEYELEKQAVYNLAHRKGAPVIRNEEKFLFVRSKVDEWMEGLIGQQI